jgi:peptide/nickel transport system substrate-binding protein
MISRLSVCLSAAFLWLALITGCADSSELSGAVDAGKIRFATGTPLQTFDPHLSDAGTVQSTYLTLVYDGLLERNPDALFEPLPGLAYTWQWIDTTTVEFNLVENVRFTDGVLFDAHVAKANIERMLRVKGPRVNTLSVIKGGEVIDGSTFRVLLHRPDPTFIVNLASAPGLMISPAAFENEDLDLNPVGTGPYVYDKAHSTIGEVHRFVPKDDYFKRPLEARAPIDVYVLPNPRARLNALISGQADIALVSPLEAKPARDIGFEVAKRANRWFGFTFLDRNGELVPELKDPRVRQAMGFAVDRRAIADAMFFGYARPASQPMVEGLGYVPELADFYRYDPVYARQLLDEAGVEEFSFEAPVLPNSSAEYQAVQHYLKKVGINMILNIAEPGSTGALARTKQYPVSAIAFPNSSPDHRHPAIWETKAVFNPFRVLGEETDRLANEARESLDQSLRERNYRAYFNIVVKEVYSLIYLQIDDLVAYDNKKLKGVKIGGFIDPRLRDIRLVNQQVHASEVKVVQQ